MLGSVPNGTMVRRMGARAGDRIFVTGTIGDAGTINRAPIVRSYGGVRVIRRDDGPFWYMISVRNSFERLPGFDCNGSSGPRRRFRLAAR